MSIYSTTKALLRAIFPASLLFRFEYQMRYWVYLMYAGDKYVCNLCNKRVRAFIEDGGEKMCPRCGSLQRTRRLWQQLSTNYLSDNQTVLDFSPSRSIYRLMKKRKLTYISSDLSGDFIADVNYNIKEIDAADESFDLIICYHILEHIDDDAQAMSELWRVLKKGGTCLVQTPFKAGRIYEDSLITSPEERTKHFGQSDHLRIYSVSGLQERLERAGFKVEVKRFVEEPDNSCGWAPEECILICKK
ncbi:class I SAM-dependent methyltransferase [Carboxylicivirga mesophila]|uniref:Class I SAM-dependent methyltransferase n=1 Tax=Carboxylicivirga mesophila TaxID=1166478 RepID=A0ABS5KAI6_9BACT|nr:methyltransferase domain-containing protein [Carboxylicivirga mesophila]MBS2211523.1 class I SAM-dependent methyltransferase [Carboxylicivirga mesophila]